MPAQPATKPGLRAANASGNRWSLASLLLGGLIAAAMTGCGEAPLPEPQARQDDCLRGLQLAQLASHLKRCDAVVAAFPQQPEPLNDRYLLRSLAGDDRGACADIAAGLKLAARLPANPANDQLRSELQLRQSICQAPERAPSPPAPTSRRSAPAP